MFPPLVPLPFRGCHGKSRDRETHFHVTIAKLSDMILGKKLIECWCVILNPRVCPLSLGYTVSLNIVSSKVTINTILFFPRNFLAKILLKIKITQQKQNKKQKTTPQTDSKSVCISKNFYKVSIAIFSTFQGFLLFNSVFYSSIWALLYQFGILGSL